MKTSEQLSRVNDSDIYFAVTFILLAFDKNGFAILAFCIGCLLCFAKRVVQRVERRIKEKENGR